MKRLYLVLGAVFIVVILSILILNKLNKKEIESFETHLVHLNVIDSLGNKLGLTEVIIENRTLLVMFNSQCQFCDDLLVQLENYQEKLEEYKIIFISFETWDNIKNYEAKLNKFCHLNTQFFKGEISVQSGELKSFKVPQIYHVVSLDEIKPIKSVKEI